MTALYELAQDYLKAGLLDRAEEMFLKLEGTPYEQAGAQVPARDLRAGEGLAEGDRRVAPHGLGSLGNRASARSRISTASWRSPR